MFFSTFEIFKIGIGPSSSHTIGPMLAANRFVELMRDSGTVAVGLRASLHGSLAFTGRGHATDTAIMLGFAGFKPESFNAAMAETSLKNIHSRRIIDAPGFPGMRFDPEHDLIFDYERLLPGHSNGINLYAIGPDGDIALRETYYSIGGGSVVTEAELQTGAGQSLDRDIPHPFSSAAELVNAALRHPGGIPGIVRENEFALLPERQVDDEIERLWEVMDDCIERGLTADGILPGGLGVKRRSKAIHEKLMAEHGTNLAAPHTINDWISVYAMAVNEENAGAGRVVTAPTNGAAGVIPATIRYYVGHVPDARKSRIADFLLTAAAIGGIIKQNASISGAECGCQAEVGSAAAMAAAGLCQVLGGTPQQVENAAEIALEHHLGMTCDPVKGLVQVPCIERNGLGAIKAVSSASLALRGDGSHFVSLDSCIDTMRRTGADMNMKYKETSLGGLAVSIPNC